MQKTITKTKFEKSWVEHIMVLGGLKWNLPLDQFKKIDNITLELLEIVKIACIE